VEDFQLCLLVTLGEGARPLVTSDDSAAVTDALETAFISSTTSTKVPNG